MATQAEKLVTSLAILKSLVGDSKRAIFRSREFSRVHKERLVKAGFLIEIKKGWLLLADPAKKAGDSTLWYSNYWSFLSFFLEERFGKGYCLSAEASLSLYTGATTIPKQLTIITEKSSGQSVHFPFNSSLFLYQDIKNLPVERNVKEGLQVMMLPEAICRSSKNYFAQHPVEAVVALSLIQDASQLLYYLLKRGQSTTAGYLIGAYRSIGRKDVATRILDSMVVAGHKITIENPLIQPVVSFPFRPQSPHAGRLQALWYSYRIPVLEIFPEAPGLPEDAKAYLSTVEESYEDDAYNSLSIEGYEVSPALIDRVREGRWNPSEESKDTQQKDALAAKGYYLAFEEVRLSLNRVLHGHNPGLIVRQDLARWYQALFSPSIQAGLLQDYYLAGYRSTQVYIQNSRHIPFPQTALLDSMDIFFELLEKEKHAAPRAILGHFFFVHIHPYSDGNGRIGRFLMNIMMAAGGYPWTIIPVSRRSEYMNALEQASCENNIVDFTRFIKSLGG
ncbi:MAG: Fic family protein [Alphaproteobacteria bacterium]|nr:Fic family protein [Alphaproteobacteria bacterium]